MDDLISIIVPFYNVEGYLKKCLDSLLEQTYKTFELILIDDGSTDNSGIICDDYAIRDHRIKVIHQQNKGVGNARNVAIGIAKGKFITFVDSDDWVTNNMLSEMYLSLKDSNADIVVAGHYVVNLDNSIEKKISFDAPILLGHIEATSLILEDKKIFSFSWDKMYKRELFDDLTYTENSLFEDISTTYKLFYKANNIIILNKAFYYYIKRESSSCLNPDLSVELKRKIDTFQAFYERYLFVLSHSEFSHMLHICLKQAFKHGRELLHYTIRYKINKNSTSFYVVLQEVSLMDLNENLLLNKTDKLEHKIMRVSTWVYVFLLRIYYTLHKK